MPSQVYLAIDLGAESGRVMAGIWNGKSLKLRQVHRFANGPVDVAGTLRWDVLKLLSEIQIGLAMANKAFGKSVVSVGADTWGVDYVLLSKSGEMLGQPFHYRDSRTNEIMDAAFRRMSREELFKETGLEFMQFNTLFQLLATKQRSPEVLEAADRLLFMPDFIHWALCGSTAAEFTIASTSQCLHPVTRTWSAKVLKTMGLPTRIFPELIYPGATLGALRPELAAQTGLRNVKVVAPPGHDTASAVAAVPTARTGSPSWAYISSGTWSLMGVEIAQASLTNRTQELNLTNEGGLDGTCRLLKNIMGLWLVQRCKKSFENLGRPFTYAQLASLAQKAKSFTSVINPDDARFLNPPDMPKAIQSYCKETRQAVPKTEGELVRCAYQSLASRYSQVLGWLEEITSAPIEAIHIVGGGSQSRLLNQLTANACGRPVFAGPVEATAMGNLLVQVRAAGEISSLAELREITRKSSAIEQFNPSERAS